MCRVLPCKNRLVERSLRCYGTLLRKACHDSWVVESFSSNCAVGTMAPSLHKLASSPPTPL